LGKPSASGDRSPGDRSPGGSLAVDAILARLPRFPSATDLLEAFPSKDALLDAYARGLLPPNCEEALELNATRLLCWLQARQLRVLLERPR
jgi:hypothetical protein